MWIWPQITPRKTPQRDLMFCLTQFLPHYSVNSRHKSGKRNNTLATGNKEGKPYARQDDILHAWVRNKSWEDKRSTQKKTPVLFFLSNPLFFFFFFSNPTELLICKNFIIIFSPHTSKKNIISLLPSIIYRYLSRQTTRTARRLCLPISISLSSSVHLSTREKKIASGLTTPADLWLAMSQKGTRAKLLWRGRPGAPMRGTAFCRVITAETAHLFAKKKIGKNTWTEGKCQFRQLKYQNLALKWERERERERERDRQTDRQTDREREREREREKPIG